MAPFNGTPYPQEQVALAIAPKVTAAISIIGSSFIIYDASKRCLRATSRNRTYHRLMVGLSVCDLSMSAGLFTSTWPMPKDTPNVWGATGNTQTCAAVGFFEQAGVGAVLYNASLSTYYLLRIRCGWTAERIVRVEYALHAVPIVFALATMTASLALGLFNSGLFDCWIAPYPQGCVESWRSPDGQTTCVRGNNASLYQWIFDVIPKWAGVLLVTLNMFITHRGVYLQERKTAKYTNPAAHSHQWSLMPAQASESSWGGKDQGSSRNTMMVNDEGATPETRPNVVESPASPPKAQQQRMKLPISRRLANQSYLYVGALYLTYIPVIVTRAYELAHGCVHYEMLLTISIMIPFQGFWNVLVYLRPRYLRELDRRRKARLLLEQKRRQRLIDAGNSPAVPAGTKSAQPSASSNSSSSWLRVLTRVRNSRVAASMQDQLSAVSQVVREGGLDDEEEDFDNETGCSMAADEGAGDDAEAMVVRESEKGEEEENSRQMES